MTYPAPVPGLVIRYSFLWSREAKAGATEGRKDRPCAIVMAVPSDPNGGTNVAVVPVTHSPPCDPTAAIELPATLKLSLGLDAEPAWVCLDELNVFAWPGFDLRVIPGRNRIDYGVVPEAIFNTIRQGIVALHRARKVRQISRD